ncbi:hypothetical protein SAMN05518683_1252 [Salibacterium halotolerans]|uniref:Uncharacterized protein n=2 Tax=Salibacterium halotolerans TaxID=1884432 RepID=A0A1I5X4P7_9BACI|nr:hypothetical protein SAMN05518683_1252 [Salibacterium halotolerans]
MQKIGELIGKTAKEQRIDREKEESIEFYVESIEKKTEMRKINRDKEETIQSCAKSIDKTPQPKQKFFL